MAQPLSSGPAHTNGPFYRAKRWVRSVAIVSFLVGAGGLALLHAPENRAVGVLFCSLFVVPGLFYFLLGQLIPRRRRWVLVLLWILAMCHMTLLGVMFLTSWGTASAAVICGISGTLMVLVAVMVAHLNRALDDLRRTA